MKVFKYILLIIIAGIGHSLLQAQLLEVKPGDLPPMTPERLITDIFLGSGVEIINIDYQGDPAAVGSFINGTRTIGIDEGMVITTGLADRIDGPDFTTYRGTWNAGGGDGRELETLLEVDPKPNLFDIASYEITFRPKSTNLSFDYVFASNEYPQFVCGEFNDVFGFFVTGPNPSGGSYNDQNIALVPNSNTPVAINNVHNGNPSNLNCDPINEQYYNPNAHPNELEYDAHLDVFTAEFSVIPCEVYTIKLAIADVSDNQFDSGIFFKARSFGSEELKVTIKTPTVKKAIQENCAPAQLVFSIDAPLSSDYIVPLSFSGKAMIGIDYILSDSTVIIPAGATSVTVDLWALNDGFTEAQEEIIVELTRGECIQTVGKLYIEDYSLLELFDYQDTTVCAGEKLLYRPILPRTNQYIEFSLEAPIDIPDLEVLVVDLDVRDFPFDILGQGIIESVCVSIDHEYAEELSLYLESPGGKLIELSSFNGSGNALQNTCFTNDSSVQIGSDPFQSIFDGSFAPEGNWDGLYGSGCEPVNGFWKLIIYDSVSTHQGVLNGCTVRIANPTNQQLSWTGSDGYDCMNCRDVELMPVENTIYHLELTNEYGCSVSDSFKVEVIDSEYMPDIQSVIYADSVLFTWYTGNTLDNYLVQINGGPWVTPNYTNWGYMLRDVNPGDIINVALAVQNPCFSDTLQTQVTIEPCTVGPHALQAINPLCYGDAFGKIELSPSDQITYWYQGVEKSEGAFDQLSAGEHLIVVQDMNGCSTHYLKVLSEPAPLSLNIKLEKDVTCFGKDEGTVNVEIENAQGLLDIIWSDGASELSRSDLGGGLHTIEITDANGCTILDSIQLSHPMPIESKVSFIPSECGLPNGAQASVQASGGTGELSFEWNTGHQSNRLTSISDGLYHVTITDAQNCKLTDSVYVQSIAPLIVEAQVERISCPEMNNGVGLVEVSGGTLPYKIRWSHGFRESRATQLSPGEYGVTVTDEQGCESTDKIVISEGADIFLTAQAIQPPCDGDGTGSIQLELNPEHEPYSVLWTSNSLYDTDGYGITGLVPGRYTVFIDDANGCQYNRFFTIDSLNPLFVEYEFNEVTCPGKSDGNIFLQPLSGNGHIQYSVNGEAFQDNPFFLNLPSGDYSVVAKDEANCELIIDSIILVEPPELMISLGNDTTIKRGQPIDIIPEINLENPNFTYQWIGSSASPAICEDCTSQSFNPVETFSLKLIVRDGIDCLAEDLISITVDNDFEILVPTAFSPNGDSQNDQLIVHGTKLAQIQSFQIFDRSYNLLYEDQDFDTNNLSRGWDGYYKGKRFQGEVVIWKVIATLDGDIEKTFTGVTRLLK